MARNVPKQKKMGYALEINRKGEPGAANWTREGFLFKTSLEASLYRQKHFPSIQQWRIFAVRVSTEKVATVGGADTEARLNPTTKGF